MKYILVLDHNNDCRKCRLCYYDDFHHKEMCTALGVPILSEVKVRPDCPLKPRPTCKVCKHWPKCKGYEKDIHPRTAMCFDFERRKDEIPAGSRT